MTHDNAVDVVAPKWFIEALAAPVDIGSVTVSGVRIAYRAWGQPGLPGLVLVHGGMAHSGWWDHIGPQLAHGRRVVALDLSGHGDSAHAETYSLRAWGEQVLAAAEAGGIVGPPTVVGHSMGGIVAFAMTDEFGDRLAGAIIFDSPLRDWTPEEVEMRARLAADAGPPKVYATVDDAVARFRLVPPQDEALPFVLDHIARTSLKDVDGGVSWKFDSYRVGREERGSLDEVRSRCPVAYFRSEQGIVDPSVIPFMRERFSPGALVADLPAAGHHPMVDQPLSVVTAVRTVLASWGDTA